ncbi:CAP domain-containing protein [Olleya marilimosa]|uniref:CAP domain-containing protein n=1 Tax=Olleya marilimosa TaxID=272164 RepID=UPI0005667CE2|nr:CAP domain-containing protein [Olleya marilimosa]
MKKLTIILIVLFNILLMSCSVDEEVNLPESYNATIVDVSYSQLDYEIIELINNYRISQGLSSLDILNEASKEAINHNNYMVSQGAPSHDYFYLRSQNLKQTVNAKTVSENVAFGFSNAQALVSAWLNSEGHRENIENPEATNIGISTTQDAEGKNYFTNIFVKL